MCSEFILFTKPQHLANQFGAKLPDMQTDLDLRVRGYMKIEKAPVIVANEKGELEIRAMCFSLCPSWSKEFPAKFTTYNARMERPKAKSSDPNEIERIYQTPTWREPFAKGQTCLVPMNAAIESSYFGKSAGHIIKFKQKNNEVYYVAGLWNQYVDKSTGEIHDTFTLITDDPYKFFYEHGHDRSVIVLEESSHERWLLDNKMQVKNRFEMLRNERTSLDWGVEIDRPMKEGWQKRAPSEDEVQDIKIWNAEK